MRREDEPRPRQLAREWAIPFVEALRAGRIAPAQSPRFAHEFAPHSPAAASSLHTVTVAHQTPKSAVLMDGLKRYLRMKQAGVEFTDQHETTIAISCEALGSLQKQAAS